MRAGPNWTRPEYSCVRNRQDFAVASFRRVDRLPRDFRSDSLHGVVLSLDRMAAEGPRLAVDNEKGRRGGIGRRARLKIPPLTAFRLFQRVSINASKASIYAGFRLVPHGNA